MKNTTVGRKVPGTGINIQSRMQAMACMFSMLTLLLATNCTMLEAADAERLTNASIIELKQLGLGDELIVEKIKASKCEFDLTIAGLKALKAASIPDPVISAMLAISKPIPPSTARPESSPANATRNENGELPEFYGLYVVSPNGLAELKVGAPALLVEATAAFIYYAKTTTRAESFGLFQLPPANQPVPTKRDGKFKGWGNFMEQSQEYSQEVQGQLDGLPRGSKPLELRNKSVPGQPEMIWLSPTTSLEPGDYQIGIRGGRWYHFTVSGRPTSASGANPPSSSATQQAGPPVTARVVEAASASAAAFQCPPEVLQNPAWPMLSKVVEASGGAANIIRATAIRTRTTARVYIDGQGFIGSSLLSYSKYPNQLRQEAVYHLKSKNVDQTLCFDNSETRGFGNGKPFTPAKTTQETLRNEVFMQNAESLRPLLEGKFRFSTNENVLVNGRSYPSITVSDKDMAVTLLFDPDTYLLAQRRFLKLDQKGKLGPFELIYSKHKQFGGLLLPGRQEGYDKGELRYEGDLQEVTFLEDVPDVYFSDPSRVVP